MTQIRNKTDYNLTKKEWRDSNKEKVKESRKKWAVKNKEKRNIITKRWSEKNREKRKEYFKKWRLDNLEKCRQYSRNRRARIYEAFGSHIIGDWETLKAQYNWTCPACGKSEPEIQLTEDHIIPLVKGGSNNIENIQPLCKNCNSRKYTKIITYSPNGEINLIYNGEKEK